MDISSYFNLQSFRGTYHHALADVFSLLLHFVVVSYASSLLHSASRAKSLYQQLLLAKSLLNKTWWFQKPFSSILPASWRKRFTVSCELIQLIRYWCFKRSDLVSRGAWLTWGALLAWVALLAYVALLAWGALLAWHDMLGSLHSTHCFLHFRCLDYVRCSRARLSLFAYLSYFVCFNNRKIPN